jgi:DNA-binding HxlR family transcriptional regulator
MERKAQPDQYCEKIFALLAMSEDRVRFNDLYRKLNKLGAKMSKPTLSEHLKHLEKNQLIERHEIDKLNVSYSLPWKKYEQLSKAKEFNQTTLNLLRDEKTFKAKSLEQQVVHVTFVLTTAELFYLRLAILDELEPENKLFHHFSYSLIRALFDCYTRWLFDTSKESEANAKTIMKHIDCRIRDFEKLLFTISPEYAKQKGSPDPESLLNVMPTRDEREKRKHERIK